MSLKQKKRKFEPRIKLNHNIHTCTPMYIHVHGTSQGFFRVVIKSQGPGVFPGYEESGPQLLLLENRRKIEPKEIPSRLIPRLLVVCTRQLEILVTTLLLDLTTRGKW